MHGKLNRLLIASLPAALLIGCGTPSVNLNTQPQEAPGGSFCLAAKPIYLDADEYLKDDNARKLQAMDKYGIAHCGWQTMSVDTNVCGSRGTVDMDDNLKDPPPHCG